jgi:hypothetical protein
MTDRPWVPSSSQRQRPVPSDLLNWRQGADWRRKIEAMLRGQMTPELKRKLRDMDPDSFFSDDLRWLEEARGVNLPSRPLKSILSDILVGWRVRAPTMPVNQM